MGKTSRQREQYIEWEYKESISWVTGLPLVGMAVYSYGEQLIPEEVKESLSGFLNSGVQQLGRVLQGPTPRVQS